MNINNKITDAPIKGKSCMPKSTSLLGDVVKLTYLRNRNTGTAAVPLKVQETTIIKWAQSFEEIYNKTGAAFAPLTGELRQRLNINLGVFVIDLRSGGFFDQIAILNCTIIINGKPINKPNDIDQAMLSAKSSVIQMLAITPDGSREALNFSLGT